MSDELLAASAAEDGETILALFFFFPIHIF